MRVALVGCGRVGTWPESATDAEPRPWERDDRPLVDALRGRGAEVAHPAWDDPQVVWENFDVALIRATWDYHHRRDAFVAWAERAARATRLVNAADVVRWNTDKRYLRELAVRQPPTVWVEEAGALGDAVRPRGWRRAIAKPAIGATAEGTLVFTTDDAGLREATQHVDELLGRLGVPVLVQPYLASVETDGERSAIAIAGQVTHWVRKMPRPGDHRVQDDYGATDGPHDPSPAERDLVSSVLADLAHRPGVAYARIDWLLAPDGPALIELELVEPCLFFRWAPHAADALAAAVLGDGASAGDGRPSPDGRR